MENSSFQEALKNCLSCLKVEESYQLARRMEKEKTNPKADCLLSICDALDITPEQLLTGKGIDPEYKDADMDYEVTRSDIKILKQIHSLGDEQYKRLMAYMKALQKLEAMESIVEEQN